MERDMELTINDSNPDNEKTKLVFKDLEFLLRQCFNDRKLRVGYYTVTKLLPAGENYGSIMMKIDAIIRKDNVAKEETLHLVAKMPSCPEKPLITWPIIFKKDLFVYTELFPMYKDSKADVYAQ